MNLTVDPKRGNAGAELRRVMRREIAQTIAMARRDRAPSKTRVHQARTSTKKLRAALRLTRSTAPPLYQRENRRLAKAARMLSTFRDADVMLDCFGSLLDDSANSRLRVHFAPVRTALVRHRREHQPSALEWKTLWRDYAAVLHRVDHRVARWHAEADFAALADELRRAYRRARKASQAAAREPHADTFHRWRKAAKAYAYQCGLLRAAWPPAMKELRHELKALTQQLGDEHDLNMLEARIRTMNRRKQIAIDARWFRAVLDLIDSRREQVRREALTLGRRLFVDRPPVIERRIKEWWSAAQASDAGRG